MKRVAGAKSKKKETVTACCGQVWNGEDALIQCDLCSTWHHFECEGLPLSAKNGKFSCSGCKDKEPVLARRGRASREHPAKRLRVDPVQNTGAARNRTRAITGNL
jgi:hypothetical protein